MNCLLSIALLIVQLVASLFIISTVVYVFGLIGWYSIIFFLVIYIAYRLIKTSNF